MQPHSYSNQLLTAKFPLDFFVCDKKQNQCLDRNEFCDILIDSFNMPKYI